MLFQGNDPWNPIGTNLANSNNANQIDAFSGLQTNLNSGHNGKSNVSPANNDPWTTHANPSDRPEEGQSMDPFSPVAQSQLAEFDVLRDQMENAPNNGARTESNNRGNLLYL